MKNIYLLLLLVLNCAALYCSDAHLKLSRKINTYTSRQAHVNWVDMSLFTGAEKILDVKKITEYFLVHPKNKWFVNERMYENGYIKKQIFRKGFIKKSVVEYKYTFNPNKLPERIMQFSDDQVKNTYYYYNTNKDVSGLIIDNNNTLLLKYVLVSNFYTNGMLFMKKIYNCGDYRNFVYSRNSNGQVIREHIFIVDDEDDEVLIKYNKHLYDLNGNVTNTQYYYNIPKPYKEKNYFYVDGFLVQEVTFLKKEQQKESIDYTYDAKKRVRSRLVTVYGKDDTVLIKIKGMYRY
jgi:hypothetical protein